MKKIFGQTVDDETRCVHYHSKLDVIAIKFKCCNKYYPCYQCHNESEDHEIMVWSKEEFDEDAIICGVCKTEHSIKQYMASSSCKHCHSLFNEGCKYHYHLYFEQ
ncbi:MAG: CHY zinc finger protein [Bacillaceae bacterium]|nr:CHY zinc finger protein [Bacillaceae bacterium]